MSRSYDKDRLEQDLLLYAVTDRRYLSADLSLSRACELALAGGATMLQLREKTAHGVQALSRPELLEEARKLEALCDSLDVPLIIDDDVELAGMVGQGVHIGQDDMDAVHARELIGDDAILGVSAQTVEQALAAQAAGADYLGVGAVFPTGTKLDAVDVEWGMLHAICSAVDIPVVAIGGIKVDNVGELAGSGIAGAAVVSAIFAADDIELVCREFIDKLRGVVVT
jgi:thiamine-phosphate pyrophosphorylase